MNGHPDEAAVPLPIDGVLDLHTFRPAEMKELIPAYLDECRRRGILSVRIVHGKGIGNLRRTVHAILERLPEVAAFRLAGADEGSWGATLVELRPSRNGEAHAPEAKASRLTPAQIADFRALIYDHYRANPRPLPWRDTADPYAILVSEIMLQQTQVDRVKGKYVQFLAAFPDIATLATASLPEVLTAWQGLGYNRRAVALHRCTQEVVAEHGGLLPPEVPALEALPGIGPYTARAIAAFAFSQPTVFIETNIRTVFIHQFCHDRHGVHDRELLPLVEQTLDRDNPRHWYYALMDYGVMLKKAHPNPGRRSAHHVRQSPFKGSNRELRSRILRHLLATPGCTLAELSETLDAEPAMVEKNLVALEREGFIVKRDDRHFMG